MRNCFVYCVVIVLRIEILVDYSGYGEFLIDWLFLYNIIGNSGFEDFSLW